MPGPSATSALIELREQIKFEQQQELKRAIGLRNADPVKSAYHTGLADGRNGIIKALNGILISDSMRKGDRASGRV